MILAFGSSGQLSQSFQKIYTKNDILFSSTNDLDLTKSLEYYLSLEYLIVP